MTRLNWTGLKLLERGSCNQFAAIPSSELFCLFVRSFVRSFLPAQARLAHLQLLSRGISPIIHVLRINVVHLNKAIPPLPADDIVQVPPVLIKGS